MTLSMKIKAALMKGLKTGLKYKWHIAATVLVALAVWVIFFRCSTETFKTAGVAANAAPVPSGAKMNLNPSGTKMNVKYCNTTYIKEHKDVEGACPAGYVAGPSYDRGGKKWTRCYLCETEAEAAATRKEVELRKQGRAETDAIVKKECSAHGGYARISKLSCGVDQKAVTTKFGQVCYKCYTQQEKEANVTRFKDYATLREKQKAMCSGPLGGRGYLTQTGACDSPYELIDGKFCVKCVSSEEEDAALLKAAIARREKIIKKL